MNLKGYLTDWNRDFLEISASVARTPIHWDDKNNYSIIILWFLIIPIQQWLRQWNIFVVLQIIWLLILYCIFNISWLSRRNMFLREFICIIIYEGHIIHIISQSASLQRWHSILYWQIEFLSRILILHKLLHSSHTQTTIIPQNFLRKTSYTIIIFGINGF